MNIIKIVIGYDTPTPNQADIRVDYDDGTSEVFTGIERTAGLNGEMLIFEPTKSESIEE